MSLVRSEMAEQPAVLERLLRDSAGALAEAAAAIEARAPRFAVIAARGSSDNAARYAQYLLGIARGMPVALATPSLHTLCHAPMDYRDALVIGISQSGASPDVVAVVSAASCVIPFAGIGRNGVATPVLPLIASSVSTPAMRPPPMNVVPAGMVRRTHCPVPSRVKPAGAVVSASSSAVDLKGSSSTVLSTTRK